MRFITWLRERWSAMMRLREMKSDDAQAGGRVRRSIDIEYARDQAARDMWRS